jgi:hypothetical protein
MLFMYKYKQTLITHHVKKMKQKSYTLRTKYIPKCYHWMFKGKYLKQIMTPS